MKEKEVLNDIRLIKEMVLRVQEEILGGGAKYLIMWGLLTLIGFSLAPFMKEWTGLFWMIAGPVGMVASILMGRAESQKFGEVGSWIGKRLTLFWVSLVLAGVILTTLVVKEEGEFAINIGLLWAQLVGVGWITTGILLSDSKTGAAGGLLIASSFLSAIFLPAFFYPVVGIVGGGSLIILGITEVRKENEKARIRQDHS